MIAAASEGVVSTPVEVAIYDESPSAILLQAIPSVILADGQSTSTIRATVTDGNGNPVPDGTTVTFSVIVGTGTLSSISATTSDGVAVTTYTASQTPGTETVKAQTVNGIAQTVGVMLNGPQIATISLSANPTSLPADGATSATINSRHRQWAAAEIRPTAPPLIFTIAWGAAAWRLPPLPQAVSHSLPLPVPPQRGPPPSRRLP